jgi:hypothetical protein
MGPFGIVFSDIDGTCVHYDMGHTFVARTPLDEVRVQERLGVEKVQFPDGSSSWVLALPQSSSGSRGIISCKTLDMYQELRRLGKKVVLVSGCRASTLIQRLPFLPHADAYVCESGGRIFYPKDGDFCTLLEDLTWRNHHSSLPPKQHAAIQPEDYSGDLWEFYRYLVSKEITVDSKNYSTAFRVKDSRITGKDVPSSLAYSTNLGSLDVYPPTSGKLNAAKYLMERFDGCPEASVFLCGMSCLSMMILTCLHVLTYVIFFFR